VQQDNEGAALTTSQHLPRTKRLSTTPAVWDARQLRIATDAAGVALWSWDVDTDEIALDERAHRMWGLPAEDGFVTFGSLSSCIHPMDLDRVRSAFASTREIFGAYETDFRILRDGAVRWVSARGRGDDQGIVGRIMFGVFLDVTDRMLAEQGREMIANEMGHRIKNIFATVAALTHIAARSTETTTAMADDIVKRLVALGNAKELIRPSSGRQHEAIGLGPLLAVLLDVYDNKRAIGDRIYVSVPDILIGEHSITILALVVHELATNSLKYGSLSAAAGSLNVIGVVDDGEVTLVWIERGGPPVSAQPGADGFGTMLIKRSIVDQLDGSITLEWRPDGVIVSIRVSQVRLAE
jgi:two-component sensor histidine kinase